MYELQVTRTEVEELEAAVGDGSKRVLWDYLERISLQVENAQPRQSCFHRSIVANFGEVEFIVVQVQIRQFRLMKRRMFFAVKHNW